MPQVAEDIAASPQYFQLCIFHRNISFNLFRRSFISSISLGGVLIPCVDFFWNTWSTQSSSPTCTVKTTRKASPLNRSAISNTPEPNPCRGFAMSALPPSVAIVSAVRQIALTPPGKSSNSFLAALNQETGRVSRVIGGPLAAAPLTLTLSYLTTIVNKTRQRSEESLLGFAPVSRCCFKLRCSLID